MTHISAPQPIALTIAGSDCSAGAGIQADLKTFHRSGVHGLSAITSVVSETPLEVREIEAIPTTLVQSQIQILLETYPINAIKIGMLPTRSCTIAICEILKENQIPIITDPVMVASTGSLLIQSDTTEAIADRLLPLSTLVTPNIPEAKKLLGNEIKSHEDMEKSAREISEKYETSCLIKGGHLPSKGDRLDILWHDGKAHHFSHPDAGIGNGIHGTGCALSSAIAAHIAKGKTIELAVESGINLVQDLIRESKEWTKGDQTIHCLGW